MKQYLLLFLVASNSIWGTESKNAGEAQKHFTHSATTNPGNAEGLMVACPGHNSNQDNQLIKTTANPKSSNRIEPNTSALTQLQKFEVMTFFPPYDKVDQAAIYDSLINSFKKIGDVAVTEDESMFCSLLQSNTSSPICYFSIEKDQDLIEISLHVIAEVVVSANQHKTACPIWKKTLFSSVSPDNSQTDLIIANLTKRLIESLKSDWTKANESGAKQPSFHIRKFESL